jgi:peptidase E
MPRRIVACGGQELYYAALIRYVFELTGKARPKILFVPTASGDDAAYLLTFYQSLAGIACEPSHLLLFNRTVDDIDGLVRSQDVVMVGGGNTANMLAIWRLHGVEDALRNAYRTGTILTGWSAGCICWFESGITDSFTPELGPLRDGVKLLKGSACPHYDSEERRRPVYAREIALGLAPGIALDDGVAASYEDEQLVEIVSAIPSGRAFRVDAKGEQQLQVRVLA